MKKYISFGTLLCVIPSLCLGYSARYTRLLQEKQRKIEELEKCTGSTGKLKIAGISTLGLTAAGVAGNVVEAQKIKEYGEESKKLDKKIAAQQETKTQLEEDIRKQEQAKKEKDEDCFNDINNKVTWVNYKIYVDLPKADDKYELSEVEAKSISDKWVYDERLDLDTITYDDPCKVLKNLDNFIKQKDKCKTLLTSAKVDNGKVVATYVYTNPDECGDGTDETINTIADNETPESVCNNLFESSDKTDYATKNCAYVLPSDNNSVEYLCAQKYSGRRCSKKRLDCYKQKGATEWKNGDELDGICTCTDTSKVWDENQAKCVSKIAGGE